MESQELTGKLKLLALCVAIAAAPLPALAQPAIAGGLSSLAALAPLPTSEAAPAAAPSPKFKDLFTVTRAVFVERQRKPAKLHRIADEKTPEVEVRPDPAWTQDEGLRFKMAGIAYTRRF